MAASPSQAFPPRKRRLISTSSFISPKLTDRNLIQSLLIFAQEISSLTPFQFLLKRHSVSLIRKFKLLAILFEELLLCNLIPALNSQTKVDHCVVDPRDEELRHEVLAMLEQIKREIMPDHFELAEIFTRLGLQDASSCREEIENLEEEVLNQGNEKSKSEVIIALTGLVRYPKCVLFRASTPNSDTKSQETPSEAIFSVDFRCPISLELMQDPMVVATG